VPQRYKADKKIREVLSDDQKKKLDQYLHGPHAEMHGNLSGAKRALVTASRLVGGSISFGKNQSNLTELANTDSKTNKSAGATRITYNYKAVLPSADAILGR
jgi:hypothetical protein